MIYKHMRT